MACTWLTVDEAANYLKVHKTTLYGYIKKRKLKVSKFSDRVIRICLEELVQLGEEVDRA